jgi:hypothetical protein
MAETVIKLQGVTVTVSQASETVFVHIQKGVFSFTELMTPEQAEALADALKNAKCAAVAERINLEEGRA